MDTELDQHTRDLYRSILRHGFVLAQVERHNSIVRQMEANGKMQQMVDEGDEIARHQYRFPVISGEKA